jgi:hypothetical protein
MTISEVEEHRYWADEHGNIWERQSYCLEPTATFVRMSCIGPERGKPSLLGGAIGCMNLSGLKPIQLPEFEKKSFDQMFGVGEI